MAHLIYHTEAFVLNGKNIREASKHLYFYTKELGLIAASAQGSRLLASKLRYALQDYSRVTVALVRGRNGWRVTSAIPSKDYYRTFKDSPEKLRIASNILVLIKRLTDEERNVPLFDLLDGSFNFLEAMPSASLHLSNFESILVLKILHNLGYLGNLPRFEPFVASTVTFEKIEEFTPFRGEAVKIINTSLKESHL